MKKARVLLQGDLKNIFRDAVMILAFISPGLIILFVNLALPVVRELILAELSYDISIHYSFFAGFLLLLMPLLLGTVGGFLMLEEKENGMLQVFSVTPLGRKGYLIYRLLFPFLFSVIFSVLVYFLTDLGRISLSFLLPLILMGGMEAPMISFFLGTYARNRVEGLALAKGLGIILFSPLMGYLVESSWHILGGLLPPYWVTQGFLVANSGIIEYLFYLIPGFGVHLIFFHFLFQKFLEMEF